MRTYVGLFIAALTVQLFCDSFAASIRSGDVGAELSVWEQTGVGRPEERSDAGKVDPSSEEEEEEREVHPEEIVKEESQGEDEPENPSRSAVEEEEDHTDENVEEEHNRPTRSVDLPDLEPINEDISDSLSKETERPFTVIFPDKVSEETEESPEVDV